MKIVIYSHSFSPAVGGTETIVMFLARGLSELVGPDLEITVATPTPGDSVSDSHLPFHVIREVGPKTLFRLFRKADVIHLAGPSLLPILIGWLLKKPVVVEHHGFQAICPNGQLLYETARKQCPGHFMAKHYLKCLGCNSKTGRMRSLRMLLLTFPRRMACKHLSANLFPTQWLGRVLQLPRGVVIHHGLPDTGPPIVRIKPALPTFTFLGRLVSTKGAHVLLQAADLLRRNNLNCNIKIIGEGPDREGLEKLASDLQLKSCVEFLGYASHEQLAKALIKTTAIVVPSLAGEVFGLVVLESMLRKECLIVSDIPSLREVIGDTGLVFPAGNAEALASCMRQLVETPSLGDLLGSAARERALELFSLERMLSAHISVYRENRCEPQSRDHVTRS
jgi:glycosyltransferase involved in cell wall biosynthesis